MSPRTNTTFARIAETLRSAKSIALVSHIRSDGDAVGSLLGLALSLRAIGKNVLPVLEDGVPENLVFLPGTELVTQPAPTPLADLDVAVALDTATHERVGDRSFAFLGGARTWLNLDHHGTNPGYGDQHYIDTAAPATGEIVYELLKHENLPIDDAVRQNLFAAISTDTGSFQFACTTARSHRIAAEMIEAGLDIAELCRLLYHTYPKRRVELQKEMLNELRFRCADRIVSWIFTQDALRRLNIQPGDTEGLIDSLRAIDSVIAAVIFEELPDGKIRVSARSKNPRLNVSDVCVQFGGGGHAMAAGARLKGPAEAAAETFLAALEKEVLKVV